MANESQTPGRWTVGKGQYLLMALVMMVVGTAGVIAGRSWGHASNGTSQLPSGNQITLPKGGLLFKTSEGKLAAKLDADEGGGFLVIYNTSERTAVTIGASTYGSGGLIGLTNGKGAGDMIQIAGAESGARFVLLSPHGKRGIELSTDSDGGDVSVNGPTGEPAVVVTTSENQKQVGGRIDIYESIAGKLLWSAPSNNRRRAP